MSFKAQVQVDIANIFLNGNEFASNHLIDGVSLPCVLDEDINQEYKPKEQYDSDGVYIKLISLFIDEADLGYVPVEGARLTIDDNYYYVVSCSNAIGLLEVKLRAYQS